MPRDPRSVANSQRFDLRSKALNLWFRRQHSQKPLKILMESSREREGFENVLLLPISGNNTLFRGGQSARGRHQPHLLYYCKLEPKEVRPWSFRVENFSASP